MAKVLIPGGDTTACLPVIASLAKKGIEVTVASHKRICVGFFSRYPRHREFYPSPQTHPEAFIERIVSLTKANSYDVIMPVGEFVAPLLSRFRNAIPSTASIPLPDWETYLKARDKSQTMKIAMASGIAIPTTYFPNEEDIGLIAGKVRFPAIIKPNIGYAAIGISVVNSKDELVKVYQKTRSQFGESTIQNYIQGGRQYKAEMVVDRQSEVKAGIVYAKLRYYPPTGGSSTLDCTVDRKDILQVAGKMLKAMGWYGVADLDFIEDPADGIPRLMEINPRYTRTIKIATVSGLDFPYIVYKVARGEEVPLSIEYKIGRCLRFLPEDVLWFLASSERWSSKPSFFRFIDINTRGEIMSWADPGPALAFLIDGILMMLNRKERDNILRNKKRVFEKD